MVANEGCRRDRLQGLPSTMKLTDFEALTFDCYGTLIDWETGILEHLRPWARRYGVEATEEELLEAFGQHEIRLEAETPGRLYPDILRQAYAEIARQWGTPVAAAEADAFARSVGSWPAFPDTPPALNYLKRHYKLVIVSNVDRASFAESNKKLGVAFDAIVTAEDVGSYKPDPRNFHYALDVLDKMGVARDKVLHTAQSRYHDIVPAKSLGLAVMWINRRREKPGEGAVRPPERDVEPDFVAAGMADFVAQHEALLRG